MDFEKPQDYVDALKRLEGFPLMGVGIKDGRLVLRSLSSHVAIPLRRARGWGYQVVRYGLDKLNVLVDRIIDRGDRIYIATEAGAAVELLFEEDVEAKDNE